MSEKYYNTSMDVTSQCATATDVRKVILGSSNIFTLGSYNYDGEAQEFCKGGLNSNWGLTKSTNYYYNDSRVPFADATTMPHPYLTKSGSTWYRSFPTSNITASNNNGVAVKYISMPRGTAEDIKIEYTSSTKYLKITQGSSTHLNVRASSNIIIDLQAPGGNGGNGAGT